MKYAALCIYTTLSLILSLGHSVSSVNAKEGSLVLLSDWGSQKYKRSVQIGEYYYFLQEHSQRIDVYQKDVEGSEALLGHLTFDDDIVDIYQFEQNLVIAQSNSLKLYNVNGTNEPTQVYGINIDSSSSASGKNFIATDDKFYFLNSSGSLHIVEFDGLEYELTQIYEIQREINSNEEYRNQQGLEIVNGELHIYEQYRQHDNWRMSSNYYEIVSASSGSYEYVSSTETEPSDEGFFEDFAFFGDGWFITSYRYHDTQENDELRLYKYEDGEYSFRNATSAGWSGTRTKLMIDGGFLWSIDRQRNFKSYEIAKLPSLEIFNEYQLSIDGSSFFTNTRSISSNNGNALFIHLNGIQEISVSNGEKLSDRPLYDRFGRAGSPIVSNNFLYVFIDNTLNRLDITDPSNPTLTESKTPITNIDTNNLLRANNNIFVHSAQRLGPVEFNGNDLVFDNTAWIPYTQSKPDLVNNRLYRYTQDGTFSRYTLNTPLSVFELPDVVELPDVFTNGMDPSRHTSQNGYFVALETFNEDSAGFYIYEDNADSFTFIKSQAVNERQYTVDSYNGYFYSNTSDGLRIYEMSEAVELIEVAHKPDIRGSLIVNDYLLTVSTYSNGDRYKLYSLEDPLNPKFLGNSAFLENFNRVSRASYVVDNLIFSSYEYDGIVNIFQINLSPTIDSSPMTMDEDTSYTIDTSVLDPEGDNVDVVVVEDPKNGTLEFDADAQTLSFIPSTDYNGIDSATVELTDTYGHSDNFTINFEILNVNDAPELADVNIEVTEDSSITHSLSVTDSDDSEFTFLVSTEPANGIVALEENGIFTYTPTKDFYGEDSFSVTVTDSHDASATSTVTVEILPVNDLPTLSISHFELDEDTIKEDKFVGLDADNDELTFELYRLPEHGTASVSADGAFSYQPDANYFGNDTIAITINDSSNEATIVEVSLAVTSVEDLPVADLETFGTSEGENNVFTLPAFDADGDALRYEIAVPPAFGTAEIQDDYTLIYTLNSQVERSDEISIRVTDGKNEAITIVLPITITQINDAPTLDTLSFIIDEDTLSTIDLPISDPENDDFEVTIEEFSDELTTIEINTDGQLQVQATQDFYGTSSAEIQITDAHGATSIYSLSIEVKNVDDVPSIQDVSHDTRSGNTVRGEFPKTDIDGEVLNYALETDVNDGQLTLDADGKYSYKSNTAFSGNDGFTAKATDSSGNEVLVKVNFDVAPAPVSAPQSTSNSSGDSGGGSTGLLMLIFMISISMLRMTVIRKKTQTTA